MQTIHFVAILLHIVAAAIWIGGVLRSSGLGAQTVELIHRTGVRFRNVGWACLAILVVTGVHDFVIGPRATARLRQQPRADEARRLRRLAELDGANEFADRRGARRARHHARARPAGVAALPPARSGYGFPGGSLMSSRFPGAPVQGGLRSGQGHGGARSWPAHDISVAANGLRRAAHKE